MGPALSTSLGGRFSPYLAVLRARFLLVLQYRAAAAA
jgi:hypothetical protein